MIHLSIHHLLDLPAIQCQEDAAEKLRVRDTVPICNLQNSWVTIPCQTHLPQSTEGMQQTGTVPNCNQWYGQVTNLPDLPATHVEEDAA